MKRMAVVSIGLAVLTALPARADDLTGVNRFLCSAGTLGACCDSGECATGTPEELNIPQFIEVDLAAKRLSATKASGLNRTTTLDYVKRVDGHIVLQGFENGRAFSILIDEKTGEMSSAVSVVGCGITVFGACTPLSSAK
jgi:hypothetical protein